MFSSELPSKVGQGWKWGTGLTLAFHMNWSIYISDVAAWPPEFAASEPLGAVSAAAVTVVVAATVAAVTVEQFLSKAQLVSAAVAVER